MTRRPHYHAACRGFSLVELMVSIVIALLLLAAIAMIFVNTRKAYQTQDRFARIQENGRFAMYYLMRDLRSAGFWGCRNQLNATTTTSLVNVDPDNFQLGMNSLVRSPLEGIDNVASGSSWAPSGTTTLPASFVESQVSASANLTTDMLTLRMLDATNTVRVRNNPMINPDEAIQLTAEDAVRFQRGQIVMVGNCDHAHFFEITNTPSAADPTLAHADGANAPFLGNVSDSFGTHRYNLADNARVYRFMTRQYYVRNNPNGIPSLYRDTNGGTANGGTTEELVEGIESLQVLYGIDGDLSNNTPDPPSIYRPASAMAVTDWNFVVSVKVGVLARTTDNRDAQVDTNEYYLLCTQADAGCTRLGPYNDRFQRRAFAATLSLKNNMIPK